MGRGGEWNGLESHVVDSLRKNKKREKVLGKERKRGKEATGVLLVRSRGGQERRARSQRAGKMSEVMRVRVVAISNRFGGMIGYQINYRTIEDEEHEEQHGSTNVH